MPFRPDSHSRSGIAESPRVGTATDVHVQAGIVFEKAMSIQRLVEGIQCEMDFESSTFQEVRGEAPAFIYDGREIPLRGPGCSLWS